MLIEISQPRGIFSAGLQQVLSINNCARPHRFPFIVSGVKRYVECSLYLDFPNFFCLRFSFLLFMLV